MPEIVMFRTVLAALWSQLRLLQADERGSYTLEQILMAMALAGAAIATGAFIVAKVNSTAQSIPTGAP